MAENIQPTRRGPYNAHQYAGLRTPRKTRQNRQRIKRQKLDQPHCETNNLNSEVNSDGENEQNYMPQEGPEYLQHETDSRDSHEEPLEMSSENGNPEHLDPVEEDLEWQDFSQQPRTDEEDEQRLFSGSRLTLASSLLLIMTFVMRHSLTGEALCDLLILLELHCAAPNIFIRSVKSFKKFFHALSTPLEFHFYCTYCSHYNGMQKGPCGACGRDVGDYFVYIPLIPQLETVISGFFQDICEYRESKVNGPEDRIDDVLHGKLYKEAFKDFHFHGTSKKDQQSEIHLSLQVNTDGVALFNSSKMSVWPVYMTLNELPPHLRYTRKCRLFAGLWFGTEKPDMQIFLHPLVQSVNNLYDKGANVMVEGVEKLLRVILLSGVFDAPARCSAQHFIQFNGYNGCATCIATGANVATATGRTLVYPFDENKADGHPSYRTHEETKLLGKRALQDGQTQQGVKGYSWLLKLRKFDIIRGVTVDYMHAVLLGVVKKLLSLWTDKSFKNQDWYIGNQVQEIDARLLSMTPPNCISRTPRKLADLSNWKASELRTFLLFYSVPVLHDILPGQHYRHFLLLVEAIFILLKSSITRTELEAARKRLLKFCLLFDVNYDQRYESSNVHSLLHLTKKVEDLGPLWSHSCFFYEDLNGDLRKLFHGSQKVHLQIVHSITVQQKLTELTDMIQPESPGAELYHRMTTHHRIQKALVRICEGISAIECLVLCSLSEEVLKLVSNYGLFDYHKVFERILFHGQVIHSQRYTKATRRNSYTVQYLDQDNATAYGFIRYYLQCSSNDELRYLAVLEKLQFVTPTMRLPSHLTCIEKNSTELTVIPVASIKNLCIFMNFGQLALVSTFPNKFERD